MTLRPFSTISLWVKLILMTTRRKKLYVSKMMPSLCTSWNKEIIKMVVSWTRKKRRSKLLNSKSKWLIQTLECRMGPTKCSVMSERTWRISWKKLKIYWPPLSKILTLLKATRGLCSPQVNRAKIWWRRTIILPVTKTWRPKSITKIQHIGRYLTTSGMLSTVPEKRASTATSTIGWDL